jgi:hypothetical protein
MKNKALIKNDKQIMGFDANALYLEQMTSF